MIFFSTASILNEPPAPGTNISKQIEAAYKVVYKDRGGTMMEDGAILTLRFYDLDPSVISILPFLVNARDSCAHHQRIVGKALEAGKANVHSLSTSVYNDVRTAFQQMADKAPQDLYFHLITKDSSSKREEAF